jgi:ubiquinone/menaquinone biosynthesis C-methylase UbiE
MVDAVAGRIGNAADVRLTVARVERMPFPDRSFDVALAMGVLEYTDLREALREIARVVRPEGLVVLTMLNPASPYRLVEWGVYWPARRLVGRLERLLGVPPERRHGARRSGIRAVGVARLRRMMREAGLQPQDVVAYDVTPLVPPIDKVVRRWFRRWRRHPERTVSRGARRCLGTGYLVAARRLPVHTREAEAESARV